MEVSSDGEQPRESMDAAKADGMPTQKRMQLSASDLIAPSLQQRITARSIDGAVLAPFAGLTLLLALFLKFVGSSWFDPSVRYLDFSDLRAVALFFCTTGILVPMLPVAVLVNEVILARKKGQTLGKAKTKICLLGLRDNRILRGSTIALPSATRLAVRSVVLYVPPAVLLFVSTHPNLIEDTPVSFAVLGAMPAYALAVVLPALLTAQRRGLHDLVAGTMVVDARALPANYDSRAIGRRCSG